MAHKPHFPQAAGEQCSVVSDTSTTYEQVTLTNFQSYQASHLRGAKTHPYYEALDQRHFVIVHL